MFDQDAHKRHQSGDVSDWRVSFGVEAVKKDDGSYKNVEYITIWNSPLETVKRPVTERDKLLYQNRYGAFKEGKEVPIEGTPLSEWATLTPADIASCKAAKVFTVEQLAEMPEEVLRKNHILSLKYKAIDFLKANQNSGELSKLRDDLDKAMGMIKTLEEKNRELVRANNESSDTRE